MKRLLDVLRPQIEAQVKSWGSCIPESGNMAPGDCLSEVTVMIRSKFRAYVQAVVEKLVENVSMSMHFGTCASFDWNYYSSNRISYLLLTPY